MNINLLLTILESEKCNISVLISRDSFLLNHPAARKLKTDNERREGKRNRGRDSTHTYITNTFPYPSIHSWGHHGQITF
jgi:hypothetical protein